MNRISGPTYLLAFAAAVAWLVGDHFAVQLFCTTAFVFAAILDVSRPARRRHRQNHHNAKVSR